MKQAFFLLLLMCYFYLVNSQTTGTITDTRDGKNYKTLKIGDQTWFAENLNYDVKDKNNAVLSVCYDNKKENCDKYGRLKVCCFGEKKFLYRKVL